MSLRIEEAKKLLDRLKEDARDGIPIVVEGKNDRKALKHLGVEGKIIGLQETKGGLRGAALINKIRAALNNRKTVIILTDPDAEGRRLCALLSRMLEEELGVHPDTSYRKMTRLFGKSAVEQLLGLEF